MTTHPIPPAKTKAEALEKAYIVRRALLTGEVGMMTFAPHGSVFLAELVVRIRSALGDLDEIEQFIRNLPEEKT